MEKVEIGGLRGRQLSSKITTIYTDFNQHFSSFAAKTYDVLDPDDSKFIQDFDIFQHRINDLDIKLAGIFCQAFNDCCNLESVFKLINILGSVLDRPKIKLAFTDNYINLLQMVDEELSACEKIYDNQMKHVREHGYLQIDQKFSYVISSLKWNKQLCVRISTPVNSFKALQHPISKSTEAEELYVRYDKLMCALGELDQEIFADWSEKVPDKIEVNLKKSLMGQHSDKSLFLNFDAELFAILRDVYHLNVMERGNVPKAGLDFAENTDMYRNLTLNLGKTINWYNDVSYYRKT